MVGIRPAEAGDATAVGRIEVETWQSTYAGMLADHLLLAMSPERQRRSWATTIAQAPGAVWVAEDEEQGLVGFGHCGRQRIRQLAYDGEVYMLYVLPDAQGIGIGEQLLLALFARLVDRDCRSALIWVARANPARFFYEHLGGRLVLERPIALGGALVDTLGYAWPDLRATLERYAFGRF